MITISFRTYSNNGVTKHSFTEFLNIDFSFYDDNFMSKVGFPDFTISFPYNPNPINEINNEIDRFSNWWNNLNKENLKIDTVTLKDNDNILATAYIIDWEENKEDFEVKLTCQSILAEILDYEITIPALINESDIIQTVQQPTTPPIIDPNQIVPIVPPGNPSISYINQLRNFFWESFYEYSRKIGTPLQRPKDLFMGGIQHFTGLSIFDIFANPINQYLQTQNSGEFRVVCKFKKINKLSRNDILQNISKLLQAKIIAHDGFHLLRTTYPIPITGYIKSINQNCSTTEIDEDKILDAITLQKWTCYQDKEGETYWKWTTVKDYTNYIRNNRNNWLENQNIPRSEYNIWGYATGNLQETYGIPTGYLQVGYKINIENTTFIIKEISYESNTFHNIKSFEITCIKSLQ